MFKDDANAKLLWHFDGADKQVFLEDWSGAPDFTIDEYVNNDAIRATARLIGGVHTFVSATTNAITVNTGAQYTPTAADYDATNGLLNLQSDLIVSQHLILSRLLLTH